MVKAKNNSGMSFWEKFRYIKQMKETEGTEEIKERFKLPESILKKRSK